MYLLVGRHQLVWQFCRENERNFLASKTAKLEEEEPLK